MSAAPGPGYLDAPPLALAHRGGVALPVNAGIENSVQAIGNAVELGFSYIETDARASRDGVAFAFHDTDLRRVAARSGGSRTPFRALPARRIRDTRLDGGARVPTIAELLAAFPTTRFNIDVKTAGVVAPTARAVLDAGALGRVLIASFSHARLTAARRLLPGVATSASPREIAGLLAGRGRARGLARRNGAVCVQVPERFRGRLVVSPQFVRTVHEEGLQVHVWTVDRPDDMHRLLDLGVDGLITDRPDVLRDVLQKRGEWPSGCVGPEGLEPPTPAV